ncbi:MAG: response regulator [Candidatus Latescibacterota bacterium]
MTTAGDEWTNLGQPEAAASSAEQPPTPPRYVLVAGDAAVVRQLICRIVRQLGCEPVEAENGNHALAQARSHDLALIVLDLNMPDKDGLETLQELRADRRLASVSVLVLTIEASRKTIQSVLGYRVCDYLVKPLRPSELRERLRKHLGVTEPEGG